MNKLVRDFVSNENREFTFKIGTTLASALAGFVAGAIAAITVVLASYFLFIR